MSMANSLEVRVPLLDHRIVELAFTLPLETKIHRQPISGHIRSKHLLKKSASRFFPESVLERPKQGFGIPVADWCLGPLMPLMRQNLLSPSSPIFDWIDANYVARLVETLNRGDRSLAGKAWFLLMMSIWFDEVHRR
jgi:asparagine synthase (glutamine-hydrolysing)